MKMFPSFLVSALVVGAPIWAQSELSISKFRFTRFDSSQFERLVIEFSGPSISEEVEVKKNEKDNQKDITLLLKNISIVGSIPEANMNASYRDKKKWTGPLSFNTDPDQKSVSIRTMLSSADNELDAFWLNQPTRLVIDVYPKGSPRAQSREIGSPDRKVASMGKAMPKAAPAPTSAPSKPKEEMVFCFPASAEINPQISFQRWMGDSSVTVKAEPQSPPSEKGVDYIRCYPAQARVVPQVFFNKGASPLFMPPAPPNEGRNLSSEPGSSPSRPDQPPSLNGRVEPKRGSDPAKLLPPSE